MTSVRGELVAKKRARLLASDKHMQLLDLLALKVPFGDIARRMRLSKQRIGVLLKDLRSGEFVADRLTGSPAHGTTANLPAGRVWFDYADRRWLVRSMPLPSLDRWDKVPDTAVVVVAVGYAPEGGSGSRLSVTGDAPPIVGFLPLRERLVEQDVLDLIEDGADGKQPQLLRMLAVAPELLRLLTVAVARALDTEAVLPPTDEERNSSGDDDGN